MGTPLTRPEKYKEKRQPTRAILDEPSIFGSMTEEIEDSGGSVNEGRLAPVFDNRNGEE